MLGIMHRINHEVVFAVKMHWNTVASLQLGDSWQDVYDIRLILFLWHKHDKILGTVNLKNFLLKRTCINIEEEVKQNR